MKRIIYILFAMFLALSFTNCEDFLDTENYTKQNTANFPKSLDDAKKSYKEENDWINHFISDKCIKGTN